MLRSVLAIALLSGCWLVFDDGGHTDDCLVPARGSGLEIAALPLRNPQTLTCETFGPSCPPGCPCPETGADLAPIPSWGFCDSGCEGLAEGTCAANPECRVVKDARCAIGLDCLTDYVGCFALDQVKEPSVACATADAWQCSRNASCVAYHRGRACAPDDTACVREFALCMPEGKAPGTCFAPVTCTRAPPVCAANTRPGVANGCYTDACIPLDLCEARVAPAG